MLDNLTRKQKKFVKEYIRTDNATEAASKVYDVKDRSVANSMGSENLAKPQIIEAIKSIGDYFTEKDLANAHQELLNQKRFEYFVFPKDMKNEEIIEKVEACGIKVVVIRIGEKGKYAFYHTIDPQARKGALDMLYKIKGIYAPEKSINLNVDLEIKNPKAHELAQKYEQDLRNHL
jgi:phage terminase small subunit